MRYEPNGQVEGDRDRDPRDYRAETDACRTFPRLRPSCAPKRTLVRTPRPAALGHYRPTDTMLPSTGVERIGDL